MNLIYTILHKVILVTKSQYLFILVKIEEKQSVQGCRENGLKLQGCHVFASPCNFS